MTPEESIGDYGFAFRVSKGPHNMVALHVDIREPRMISGAVAHITEHDRISTGDIKMLLAIKLRELADKLYPED